MRPRSDWTSVRCTDSAALHAIAGRLHRQRFASLVDGPPLTEGQEVFWDEIVKELEWRSARRRRAYKRCVCSLCWSERTALTSADDASVWPPSTRG